MTLTAWMRRSAMTPLALACVLVCSPAAYAQDQAAPLHRSPAQRELVSQLAYVLGQAHALHRLCAGPDDTLWYSRMERLEAQEGTDDSFRRRLVESFNAGFAYAQASFPECGRASQAAERQAATRGGVLARRLAGGG